MEWLLISWPTLILLGIGLRMSLRLTYGSRGPEPGDPVHAFLNITGWVLIALGLAPAILGGIFSVFGSIVVVMAIATLVEMIVLRRTAQRRSMCRMLSLILERGAHLESSVFLAGQALRGSVGRAAQRLFDALNGGMPLTAAIVREPKAIPPEALAYLAAGSSRQARIAALRELSRPDQGELTTLWRNCIDRVSYLLAVMMFMGVLLTFIMIKIVPEFRKIFDEFDLDLPALTQLLIAFSQFIVTYLALPIAFLLLLLILSAIAVAICYLCDLPALRWLSDRIFRGRRIADVLRILALATENREPLAEVLNRVAVVYPSAPIRRQVTRAATEVAAGADWRDALRNARIVNQAEQSLLKTAEQIGNLPWALREIAKRREKLIVYWFATRLQIAYPLIILLMGLLVGFYAISLFIPLVRLISGLSY
jgi:type II secretory pathway component PulF